MIIENIPSVHPTSFSESEVIHHILVIIFQGGTSDNPPVYFQFYMVWKNINSNDITASVWKDVTSMVASIGLPRSDVSACSMRYGGSMELLIGIIYPPKSNLLVIETFIRFCALYTYNNTPPPHKGLAELMLLHGNYSPITLTGWPHTQPLHTYLFFASPLCVCGGGGHYRWGCQV